MRRRDFIKSIVGSTAVWPINSHAQQLRKLPRIGYLGSATLSATSEWVAAFVQRLRELGWVDGHNVVIEFRWAEGKNERYASIATEFVHLRVDVIVTSGTLPVLAARKATADIPIVFAAAGDPVGNGLVASLARPGGNVTGLSVEVVDLAGKQIELLREVVPKIHYLGILTTAGNPAATSIVRELQTAAHAIGLEVTILEIKRAEDIAPAFDSFKHHEAALYVLIDPLMNTNRTQINTLALSAHLATIYAQRDYVEAGALMSYGPDFPQLWRRTTEYVDKILHGIRPADIPVEQPTKFDLVINLTTAKALGLEIPQTVITRADAIIQ